MEKNHIICRKMREFHRDYFSYIRVTFYAIISYNIFIFLTDNCMHYCSIKSTSLNLEFYRTFETFVERRSVFTDTNSNDMCDNDKLSTV